MEAVGLQYTDPSGIEGLLKKARQEGLPVFKVECYLKAAILQVCQSQKEAASTTLDLAKRQINPREFVLCTTGRLCRIAGIRWMINPEVMPQELQEAADLEEAEAENKAPEFLAVHVKHLCLLADAYCQVGNVEKAAQLLDTAIKYADQRQDLPWIYVENLLSIARIQIRMALFDDATHLLNRVLERVSDLKESQLRITVWTEIAILFAPVDAATASKIICLAQEEIKNFQGKGKACSEAEIENALKALNTINGSTAQEKDAGAISSVTLPVADIEKHLKWAREEQSPSFRARYYCSAARLQLEQSQEEAALATLDLARCLLFEKIETMKGRSLVMPHLETDALCEIAAVRLLVHPDVLPEELKEVRILELKERIRYRLMPGGSVVLPSHVKHLCRLAWACYEFGDAKAARELLEDAKWCAKFCGNDQGRMKGEEQYTDNLLSIAALQSRLALSDDATACLNKALDSVLQMGTNVDRIEKFAKIAYVFIRIDPERSRQIIKQAREERHHGLDLIDRAEQELKRYLEGSKEIPAQTASRSTNEVPEDAQDLAACRADGIKQLLDHAIQEKNPGLQLELYCDAAWLRFQESGKSEASSILDLAVFALLEKIETHGSSAIRMATESLRKIAMERLWIRSNGSQGVLKEERLEVEVNRLTVGSDQGILLAYVQHVCLLASKYYEFGEVETAREVIRHAESFADYDRYNIYADNFIWIAEFHVQMEAFEKAISYLNRALDSALKMNNHFEKIERLMKIRELFTSISRQGSQLQSIVELEARLLSINDFPDRLL